MTSEVSSLVLAVDSRQVNSASVALDRFSKSGKNSETAVSSLSRGLSSLKVIFAGVGLSVVTRQAIAAADSYNNLSARVRLATKSATEFATAQKALFDISQNTRVGLEQTSDLFGSLTRSTEALGVSQTEVLDVVTTINQALRVSGTSAQSAAAALVQLGQGFASGTLRGEELNSVLEQAPRLARAIADGLGVPIGKLREMGKEGELTGEKVFQALQKSAEKIQAEFDQLPLTVDQASTQAANAMLKLIGAIDGATSATGGLAGAISDAAGWISELADEIERVGRGDENVGFLALAFQYVSETLQILYQNVKFIFTNIGLRLGAMAAQIKALASLDIQGFRAISDAVNEDVARARKDLDLLEKQILVIGNVRFDPDDQSEAEARRLGILPPNAPPPARPSSGSGGAGTAKKISEVQRYLESLNRQLQATKDLSVAETLLDDIRAGRLGKVTAQQQAELLGIAQQIDGARALKKELEEQERQATEAERAKQSLFEEGQRIYEETRTPLERLNAEIEHLNDLLKQGAIDWDTYNRAIVKSQDDFKKAEEAAKKSSDTLDDFTKRAAENIQDSIGDGLFDILQGNFDNIGKSFKAMLDRMIAEALAAQLARKLFGGMVEGGSGSGWIGDLFGSVMGGLFGARAIGGPVSAGGLYRVNERGPEMLNVAGRQFLMMGNQGGHVQPDPKVGGQQVNLTQNFHITGQADGRTQQQIAAAAMRGGSSALRRARA